MADAVNEVHSSKTEDLSARIQKVNSIVVALANDSPSLAAQPESTLSESPAWTSPLLSPMPESFRLEYSHPRSTRSNTYSWTSLDHRRPSHAPSDISNTPSLSDNSDRGSASQQQHTASASPTRQRSNARWQSISSVGPLSVTDEEETLRHRPDTPPYSPTMALDSADSLTPMPLALNKGRSGHERSRSASTTASQQEAFERAAFRDSAILCEL